MIKKLFLYLILLGLFLNFSFIQTTKAQEKAVAQTKFNLTDFRNPSEWRGRFGLLQFSPDGKSLAVSGTNRDIKIYDIETGKLKSTVVSDKSAFNAFSFSPDSKTLIVQDIRYLFLKVFETDTGKLLRKIDGRGAFSSLKKLLIAEAGKDLGGLEMVVAPVSSDWQKVLIGKNDGRFEIVDLASGETRQTLEHASKSSDAWDVFKIAFASYFIPVPGSYLFFSYLISEGRFSPDGKFVVIANGDKSPTLWNAETGKLIDKLEPQTDRVYNASFSSNSKLVATSDVDGVTKIWETETGNMVSSIGSEKDKNFLAAWSSNQEIFVTIAPKNDARFWDAKSGKLLFSLEKSEARNASFSSDGKFIATTHQDDKKQMAQIWDAETGKLLATLPRQKSEDRAFSLTWSPDGKFLVTASKDFVKIWNTKGELLQTLGNAVFPVRFSTDGKFLATGGKNDVGFVWQIE